jgi:polyphosphate kinase 2 (PPK2 family)
MKNGPSGSTTSLKNGTISVVSISLRAVTYRAIAAPSPATDCQKYLWRAIRPRELPTTSFR